MKQRYRLAAAMAAALALSACGGKKAADEPGGQVIPSAADAASQPQPQLQEQAVAPQGAAFDVSTIAVTDKLLGAFPFFTPPSGYYYSDFMYNARADDRAIREFDRSYYAVSGELAVPVEGKTYKVEIRPDSGHAYEKLRLVKSYEKAIVDLGGILVYSGKADQAFAKFRDTPENGYLSRGQWNDQQTYVIRTPTAEIWVGLSTDNQNDAYLTITQKDALQQTIGLIPESAMKQALDKDGHIALYINFDTGMATIRPESQAVVDEIHKLLENNPDLKLRIEGHTDDTGDAAHNMKLSEQRAASVSGSLLAKGIAQDRLQAQGLGATKPVADNKTDDGKAKNRRVEIVKIS